MRPRRPHPTAPPCIHNAHGAQCKHNAGEDAYRKIRAGASLVELYTALAYEGPAVIPAIKQQLAECLARDGFESVSDAVGVDAGLRGRKRRRSGSA